MCTTEGQHIGATKPKRTHRGRKNDAYVAESNLTCLVNILPIFLT